MGVQDDRREIEQLDLFELRQADDRARDGTDGLLDIDGLVIEFELKSTTKDTVTTVRDFGMDHIRKWSNKHWLFGFYTGTGNALKYTRYASPSMMAVWVNEKKSYIETDFKLAQLAPSHLKLDDLYIVLGKKEKYDLADAMMLHKKQYTKEQYAEKSDLEGGYSPAAMLEILQARCKYVIERGSTLNNPHIPKGVLEGFPKITEDHPQKLRELVRASFADNH